MVWFSSLPVTQLNNTFHQGNSSQKARRSQSMNMKKEKGNILRLSFNRSNNQKPKVDDLKRPESENFYTPRNSTHSTPMTSRRQTPTNRDETTPTPPTPTHNNNAANHHTVGSKEEREHTINLLNQLSVAPRSWDGTCAPRRLFLMRHAERVDLTFGHDWFKMYIDEKGDFFVSNRFDV